MNSLSNFILTKLKTFKLFQQNLDEVFHLFQFEIFECFICTIRIFSYKRFYLFIFNLFIIFEKISINVLLHQVFLKFISCIYIYKIYISTLGYLIVFAFYHHYHWFGFSKLETIKSKTLYIGSEPSHDLSLFS